MGEDWTPSCREDNAEGDETCQETLIFTVCIADKNINMPETQGQGHNVALWNTHWWTRDV